MRASVSGRRLAFVVMRAGYPDFVMHVSNEITKTGMMPGSDDWPGVSSICGRIPLRSTTGIGWMLFQRWDYWFSEPAQRIHDRRPREICVDCFLKLLT